MSFKVTKSCCNQCLFGPDKIVSDRRKTNLLKEITREQSYFVCHKSTIKGEDTCCRGFYETMGHHSQIIRIAERIGAIEFVEEQTP